MKVYHMSDTLKLGQPMTLDYKKYMELTKPFVQALERSEDCFYGMILNAKYLKAALGKFGLMGMQTNYIKWAVEGIFEYVRQKEYPESYCRLQSNYFFDTLESCQELFEIDWGNAPDEEKEKIKLFVVELDDEYPQKRDMRLFDEAFDIMWEHEDVQAAFNFARRYFSGDLSANPVLEMLSDKNATAILDITEQLHTKCKE